MKYGFTRVKQSYEVFYSCDALPIFAENVNGNRQNHQMLQSISDDSHTITAINYFPKNISNTKIKY